MYTFILLFVEARDAGHAMREEVESLAARVGVDNALSLPAAQRLSKEVGLLIDVRFLRIQHFFFIV